LQLDGTSAGNAITDSISNGTAASVALSKANTSTWTLSGASTYTGATNVNGGELIVTGSLTGTSSVSVAAGATLSGNSSIITSGNIALAAGSFLEPGNGENGNVGTLLFATGGFLDLSAATGNSGSLQFELAQPGASDSIALSFGAINVGTDALGFSDFAFNALAGFGAGTYTLIDSATLIVGTLDPANLGGNIGAFTGTLAYNGDGTDIVMTVIPEPGSFGLLLGAATLLGFRRRR
jgi:autotransporter-associated beta strand protein